MSGHRISADVRFKTAAPKNATPLSSFHGGTFQPSTIVYSAYTVDWEVHEAITVFSGAGEGYANQIFIAGTKTVPDWVPEPPEEYKRLLAALKEVAS